MLSQSATLNNQFLGMTYDASGNLTNDGGGNTYTYDDENRLTATAGYTYVYDGDGKRVKKCSNSGCTSGTIYWTGTGSDAISEAGVGGSITEEYVFFEGERVARRDASGGAVHYYFSDHLKSADVITSNVGAIQEESDYFPYGGEKVVSGSDINNYKFTGKERDAESGLDYFDARHYANNFGRFMQPDWAARPTNVPYAVFGDPQSLNLYGYVRNDPVSRADADGHGDPEQADSGSNNGSNTNCRNCPTSNGGVVTQPPAVQTAEKEREEAQKNTLKKEAAIAYAAKTNGTVEEHKAVVSVIENRASSGDKQYVDHGKDVNVDNVINHNGGFAEVKSTQYQDYLQGRAANPGATNAATAVESVHKNGPTTNATSYIANPGSAHPRKSQVRSLGSVKPASPKKVGGVYLYVPRHPHPSQDH